MSRLVASKSSGAGQWLAITERPPAPMKLRTSPSSALPPPLATPASRVAATVAAPAVSHAERMTRSALILRSKISWKVSSPSESWSPNEVTSAGRAGHDGRGAVTRPWVAKWMMR